jgi:predicted nucleotide-binding protein
MNEDEVIERLIQFRERLNNEVVQAYTQRGSSFGRERFSAWRRQFTKFLDEHLPGESSKLDAKLHHFAFYRGRSESDAQVFWREDGEPSVSFIDSLIIDIKNDEFDFNIRSKNSTLKGDKMLKATSNRVFIVHGHDELTKTMIARFIEKLGYEAVILHEQASRGMTIIEKIEASTDVGFAIVLYTPDDQGNSNECVKNGEFKNRARQNVVFEHGYLIAKLGRERVMPLVKGRVELPSDISGVVYVDDTNWQVDIAKEMKSAGYSINFNNII